MFGDAYRRGHQRVVGFVDGRDLDVVVPACPDWTALDLLRHLAGDADDVVARRLDGLASEEWTQAQLDRRSGMDADAVLEEWAGNVDAVADALDGIDAMGLPDSIPAAWGRTTPDALPATLISDLLHHEFDLRNAYGDRNGRDLMDLHFSAGGHVRSIRGAFQARDLPTIRVESTDAGMGWDVGYGDPVATLRAPSFALMRGIGGRRTRSEMVAMGWDGDPEPFVDAMVLPHLAMRETSLRE